MIGVTRSSMGTAKELPKEIAGGALVLVILLALPGVAGGEWYVSGYAGGSLNGELSSASLSNGTVQLSDVRLEDSLVFGGKAGYFFESPRWLGVEVDGSAATADIPGQSNEVQIITPGGIQTETRSIAAKSESLTIITPSLVLRYPGDVWQPYLGAGAAIILFDGDALLSFGLQIGLRLFLLQHAALFAEYRYRGAESDRVDLSIGAATADLGISEFVAGLSLHFL